MKFCIWFSIQINSIATLNHSNAACILLKSNQLLYIYKKCVSAGLKQTHSQASCVRLRMKACSFEEGSCKRQRLQAQLIFTAQYFKLRRSRCNSSLRGGCKHGRLQMPWKSVTLRTYFFTQGEFSDMLT